MAFPDVEVCIADLLRPLVEEDDHIGNFVIVDFDEMVLETGWEDTPFIEVHELDGDIDNATFTKWPVLEVLCWGKSRDVARQTAAAVTKLIVEDNFQEQFEAGGELFDSAELIAGSAEQKTINPDNRCVTLTFQLECRPIYN